MSKSRRFFLKSGALAVLTAGLAFQGVRTALAQDQGDDFPIPNEVQKDPLMAYNRSTFEPYVHSIFQVPDAQGRLINLTLISVTQYIPPRDKVTTSPPRPMDSFALMFRAARSLPPFTSIHKMRHAALGEFNIFLSPRRTTNGRWYYEAVFSRTL